MRLIAHQHIILLNVTASLQLTWHLKKILLMHLILLSHFIRISRLLIRGDWRPRKYTLPVALALLILPIELISP
ncbi:hypothetical protein D3C80_1834810 [compost metagenome]